MESISVLLVDDHPVVRQGLVSLLAQYPDMQVVGEADRATAALEGAKASPDVILLDIRLDDTSGLDLARQLRRSQCRSRIIILTSYDDDRYLLEAAQIGVEGYLLKNSAAGVLAETIRAVYAGERRISPALGGKVMAQLKGLSQSDVRSKSGLSDEELQLLQLIADGVSVQDMTRALYWSERTVKRKTKDVLEKLGASSRAQAVAKAYKCGLLS